MKYQKIIVFAVVLTVIVFLPSLMYAPPFDPPDGGGTPLGDPVGAPIDGGLSALIAGGIALLVRKFYKKKTENK